MAKLTIELELDNAAFDPEPNPEVARILTGLAARFDEARFPYGNTWLVVRDLNGNATGRFRVEA